MKNASEVLFNKIKKVLEHGENGIITPYRIAKEVGFSNATPVHKYIKGESDIKKMSLEFAAGFEKLYEEMEKMENIKQIIEGIEAGKIEVDNEADYEDINGVEYIAHYVDGHEDLEVLFEKREDANEIDPNELDDVFNYDVVAAYRIDGGDINWV